PLAGIWETSPAFQVFRGDAWMPEPCRSCDRRHTDFGGCRGQAFRLTGEAAATDPTCQFSPHQHLIEAAPAQAAAPRPAALISRPPRAPPARGAPPATVA